ncbi:hypothetical protein KBD09_00685 [Candidatus Woesebacteria bacterium]|nr:hypothetical protein [Candidatus Woesebacteria bacterium]
MKPVENTAKTQLVQPDSENIIHKLSVDQPLEDMTLKKTFSILGLVVVLGIVSGFGLSYLNKATGSGSSESQTANSESKGDVKETAGIVDKKTFKDSAEGEIQEGGDKSGEGSFKLIRPGGEDQTAYLTSSTVDLSEYVGKKVRVYGETFSSQNVAWLMDVGYVEVLK